MVSKQKLQVAIDFGSTNSVIGWQWYTQEGAYLKPSSIVTWNTYPTVIIESQNNAAVQADVFAQEALDVQKKLWTRALKVKTDFKKALLFPEKAEYAEGKQLTKKFFRYLYREFQNNCDVPADEQPSMDLLLTAPLGIHPRSVQDLRQIALDSGFNPENGFESITVINEARCLVNYAFSEYGPTLIPQLRHLVEDPEKTDLALFVDIGGLTGDFTAASIRYDPAQKQFVLPEKPLGLKISNGSDLGGIELDKALLAYLQKEKLIPAQTAEDYVKNRGYQMIREYKENANNRYWRNGGTPEDLGGIPYMLSQWNRKNNRPEEACDRYEKQLTREVMEQTVFAGYIERLIHRLNIYLQDIKVSPESIDWIFLTGGGSQVFFMSAVLRGEFAPKNCKTLKFTKITENKARLVRWRDDPTASCVRGALTQQDVMEFIRASNADYAVQLTVDVLKGPFANQSREFLIPVISKNQTYPICIKGTKTLSYEMSSTTRIQVKANLINTGAKALSVIEQKPMDTAGKIDAAGARMTMRKNNAAVAEDVIKIGGSLLKTAGLLALGMASPSLRGVASKTFNDEVRTKNITLNNKYSDTLTLYYEFSINENGQMAGSIRASSPVLEQNDGQLELVIT